MIRQSIDTLFQKYRSQLFLQFFLIFLFLRPEQWISPFYFPALYHGVLYYWILYQPQTFSLFFVFIGSLFHDVLIGVPLGCTFLELAFLSSCAWSQRKQLIQEPFFLVWSYFAFCIALLIAIKIVFQNFQEIHFSFPLYFLTPFLCVVSLYPVLTWLLSRMNRRFGPSHG